jgi:hypothetical protein
MRRSDGLRSRNMPELRIHLAVRRAIRRRRGHPLHQLRTGLPSGQVVRQTLSVTSRQSFSLAAMPAVQRDELDTREAGRILCHEFVPSPMPGLFVNVGCQEMMPAKSEPLCREAAICTGHHASLMVADRSHHWWLQSPCDLVFFCVWPENFLNRCVNNLLDFLPFHQGGPGALFDLVE